MMKKRTFATILILLLTAVTAKAEMSLDFKAKPLLMMNSGEMDYTIEVLGWDLDENQNTVLAGIRSKLEFPLDCSLLGFEFELSGMNVAPKGDTGVTQAGKEGGAEETEEAACGKRWWINLSSLISINDPDTKMEDHDWEFNRYGDDMEWTKISWTESRSKIDYLLLKLEAALSVARGSNAELALMAGFHYYRIECNIVDYAGWQLNESDQVVEGSAQVNALYYKAIYKLPHAGVRLMITPSWQTKLEAQMTAGRLMAEDFDDHLLRGKTASASTTGWAFLGHVKARLMLAQKGSVLPFISGQAEWVIQKASGYQTQRWYRDEVYFDPNTNEEVILARKGDVISGIDYETTARQVRIGVGFGLAF